MERVEIGELYAGFWEDRWYRVVVKDIINRPLLGINAMVSNFCQEVSLKVSYLFICIFEEIMEE